MRKYFLCISSYRYIKARLIEKAASSSTLPTSNQVAIIATVKSSSPSSNIFVIVVIITVILIVTFKNFIIVKYNKRWLAGWSVRMTLFRRLTTCDVSGSQVLFRGFRGLTRFIILVFIITFIDIVNKGHHPNHY